MKQYQNDVKWKFGIGSTSFRPPAPAAGSEHDSLAARGKHRLDGTDRLPGLAHHEGDVAQLGHRGQELHVLGQAALVLEDVEVRLIAERRGTLRARHPGAVPRGRPGAGRARRLGHLQAIHGHLDRAQVHLQQLGTARAH